MKYLFILLAIVATSFSSCKKCWDCGIIDGNSAKVCNKEQMQAIESQAYTDINGKTLHKNCH